MNVVSVSWADHLVFGDEDGRLDTPEKLARRMRVWRDELGVGILHWRVLRTRIRNGSSSIVPAETRFDGLFLCLRSHEFDLQAWRDLQGEYMTVLLRELRCSGRRLETRRCTGATGLAAASSVASSWTRTRRCADEEHELCAIPGVAGLVFSSFRYDNTAAIARDDWRAGASRQQSSMSGSRTLSR